MYKTTRMIFLPNRKCHMQIGQLDKMDEKGKEKITEAINSNEDVLSMWLFATGTRAQDPEVQIVFHMIVSLFEVLHSQNLALRRTRKPQVKHVGSA